jgi:hypothetical protein
MTNLIGEFEEFFFTFLFRWFVILSLYGETKYFRSISAKRESNDPKREELKRELTSCQ